MSLIISDIKLQIDHDESSLKDRTAGALCVLPEEILSLRTVKRAVDARKKHDICFAYSIEVGLSPALEAKILKKGGANIQKSPDLLQLREPSGQKHMSEPIAVVGLGPAGLFAAYYLSKFGYKPIIIERGMPVEERSKSVGAFFAAGTLDPESNVMFGEGGAGTFSDGKLTTRIKDPYAQAVIETLVRFGAPKEAATESKPHIGTDMLKKVVSCMRREIERMGGEVRFNTKLTGIKDRDGALHEIITEKRGVAESIKCCACILAIGQGARDTYSMLYSMGAVMTPKPFAVGVRIEHPRELIDKSQYGAFFDHPRLGAAEYRLTSRHGDRGVYTFCMCPGGQVIASSSDFGQVAVNGMSDYSRAGKNSNSAVVVQVNPSDFAPYPLGGMEFQAMLEHRAFEQGGGDYRAPAQRAGDFLKNIVTSSFSAVKPTYLPGVKCADLSGLLPDFIAEGIKTGIRDFGKKLKGFDMYDAVLTAVESRTSAPLRIVRNSGMESESIKGLYPVGEGAGYAGGIVSAAVDGMRAAEKLAEIYKPRF